MKICVEKTITMIVGNLHTRQDEINEKLAKSGKLFNATKIECVERKEASKEVKAEVLRNIVYSNPTFGRET